jgi:hypothetical protein
MELPVAVFTGAAFSSSPRRALLRQLIAGAQHVFRFGRRENASLTLTTEKRASEILEA